MLLHRKSVNQHEADKPGTNRPPVGTRLVWGILVLMVLVLGIASIPAYFSSLTSTCTGTIIRCFTSLQLTPGNMQALYSMHLSPTSYAVYMLVLAVIASLVCIITGAIICWRLWGKSEERLGLFVSLLLITMGSFGILNVRVAALEASLPASPIQIVLRFAVILLWVAIGIFFYTFPDGHFNPRWTRFLVILWVVEAIFFSLPTSTPLAITNWPTHLFLAELLLTFGSAACVMIYRYRHIFNSSQRQQTKWLVFGFALILPVNPIYAAIGDRSGAFSIPDSPYQLLEPTLLTLIVLVVPLSISFAILRYRLWDIDLLINRTLVYGLLTGVLALIYIAVILSMQLLFHGLIEGNSISLVVSTLLTVALFHPLRSRIQRIIDRRFYRSKYDTTQILASFSATLRNELDLNQLREQLIQVVEETIQPTNISLWLRPPERHKRE